MPEYWLSVSRIFPYKDRIVDYVLLREKTDQKKPVFLHILRSAS